MRRPRARSPEDLDAVDVLLVEDEEDADEFLRVLRQLALEAAALRANNPGDPRTEPAPAPPPPPQPRGLRRLTPRRR